MLNLVIQYSFDKEIKIDKISDELIDYILRKNLIVESNPSNKIIYNIFSDDTNGKYIQMLIYNGPGHLVIKLKLKGIEDEKSGVIIRKNKLIDIIMEIPKFISEIICKYSSPIVNHNNSSKIILDEVKYCPYCGEKFKNSKEKCEFCKERLLY
ncbi:MAG: hypothetical protein ACTSPY_05345 [Candidatus Helarchaeota archaeon]